MTAAVSTPAPASDPAREPGPGPPALDVEVVPGGGDGEGEQERDEEEIHDDDEREVRAGQDPPHSGGVPFPIEQRAEGEARVGDRLEEVMAVVERAWRDAPRQVEEEVAETGEQTRSEEHTSELQSQSN